MVRKQGNRRKKSNAKRLSTMELVLQELRFIALRQRLSLSRGGYSTQAAELTRAHARTQVCNPLRGYSSVCEGMKVYDGEGKSYQITSCVPENGEYLVGRHESEAGELTDWHLPVSTLVAAPGEPIPRRDDLSVSALLYIFEHAIRLLIPLVARAEYRLGAALTPALAEVRKSAKELFPVKEGDAVTGLTGATRYVGKTVGTLCYLYTEPELINRADRMPEAECFGISDWNVAVDPYTISDIRAEGAPISRVTSAYDITTSAGVNTTYVGYNAGASVTSEPTYLPNTNAGTAVEITGIDAEGLATTENVQVHQPPIPRDE